MTDRQTGHIPEEQLSAFAEGELDQAETERVAEHLAACRTCSELLEEIDHNRSLLANLVRHNAPERFARRVEGRIRRRSRGRFFDYRWHVTTYLGAAIVLVILAALYFFSQAAFEVRDADTGLSGHQLRDAPPIEPTPETAPDAGED